MRSEVVFFTRCSWKKWVVLAKYFFHQFVPSEWSACSLSYDRWSNTRYYFSLQTLPLLYAKTILPTTTIMLLFSCQKSEKNVPCSPECIDKLAYS